MMEIHLSKRLEAVASRIPPGSRLLADIGSDHAFLPLYAVSRGLCRKAVAGDVHDGPLRAARANIRASGLEDRVEARKGDGLAVLGPGEADVIAIAGMGGATMAGILEAGKDKLAGAAKLLLQPNVGAPIVRRWLQDNGWVLQDECVVEEAGLFYEILEAGPATGDEHLWLLHGLYAPFTVAGMTVEEDLLMQLGPHLVRKPTEAFFAKWAEELAKREKIAAGMMRAKHAEAMDKRARMLKEAEMIREVLQCLPMAKPSSS